MLHENRLILLAGASGELGRRLLVRLDESGYRVRCLVADAAELDGTTAAGMDVVRADLLVPQTLPGVMDGVDTAIYLPTEDGAGSPEESERRGRQAAANFADAARAAGVRRLVTLAPLVETRDRNPAAASWRQQLGAVLRAGGVPVIEFRAALRIGPHSPAFELVRALVERLPVILCPREIDTPKQPIAVEDVIRYLLAAIETTAAHGRVFEIGGPDRVTFRDILREYAQIRGLRRAVVRVPAFTPRLSRLWLGLIAAGRSTADEALLDELHSRAVITDPAALMQFPEIRPLDLRQQLRHAAGLSGAGSPGDNGHAPAPVSRTPLHPPHGWHHWVEQAWQQEHRWLSAVSQRRIASAWQPPVDVLETADGLLIVLDVPGVAPDQLDVTLRDNRLTIRGRREPSPVGPCDVLLRSERPAGPFVQTIPLHVPVDPDSVAAQADHGQMRIHLTKRTTATPRRIPIQRNLVAEPD